MFTVSVLGSGTSVPSPHRMAPAHLVRCQEVSLLLDCGSGCTTGLVRELEDGEAVALGPLTFSAHRVNHTRDSLAYRVESNGRLLCFSGASARCPGLERAARGVDLER
jgi:ribonuclease BN (tRNA processing enzyme)